MTLVVVAAANGMAWAQKAPSPAPQPPASAMLAGQPASPATSAPGTAPPAAAEPYTYNPDGRRDPFVSLVSRGFTPLNGGKRTDGVAGVTTAEIVVKGVLQSRGSYVAVVLAPDGKTYIVHVNDRLLDGTVKSITPQGLVILQEVNDPLSLIKQREVRKGLRESEDGK